MRHIVIIVIVALAAFAGAGYYFLYGREFVYRLTEAEIQQALSARLPLQRTYLFVIQVTLANPRVRLVEGSSRVNAGLDITLNLTVGNSPLPLGGSLDASGGIRYEPGEGKFYLTDAVVERIQVEGIPEEYASQASKALTVALAEYYRTRPIYTLNTVSAKHVAAKLVLKSVEVKDRQLVAILGFGRRD